MSNANKLLLHKYVNMGYELPKYQFEKLPPSLKKDYIRRVQMFDRLDRYMMYILSYLPQINGDLYLPNTNIKSLGNLKHVGGFVDLYGCVDLTSLGNLEEVGGWLDLQDNINLTSLGNLWSVGAEAKSGMKHLNLKYCENLKSLGNLEYVGGYLSLRNCENVESFGNLKYVGGHLNLIGTPLAEMYSEEQIREKINVVGEIKF